MSLPSRAARDRATNSTAARARTVVSVLRVDALDDQDILAWRDLARRTVDPNPCYEPEFLRHVPRTLGPADLHLIVASDGDQWRAMVPVMGSDGRRRRGRPPVNRAWHSDFSWLTTPLVDRDRGEGPLAAVLDRATRFPAVGLILDEMPLDGPAIEAIQAVLPRSRQPIILDHHDRAALRRRAEETYLHEALGSRSRSKLAQKRRGLERDLGDSVTVDRLSAGEGVEMFLALEARGWKGREKTAMACSDDQAAFFRRTCMAFDTVGRLEILALRAGDRVLALRVSIVDDDTVFTPKITFDEDFSRSSPGRLLEVEYVSRFHSQSQREFMDSCAAREGTVLDDLWPDRQPIGRVLVPAAGARGRIVSMASRWGRRGSS
jgi:CelD/BcsL family acetyltransferase involved in cellulose biosynthesis